LASADLILFLGVGQWSQQWRNFRLDRKKRVHQRGRRRQGANVPRTSLLGGHFYLLFTHEDIGSEKGNQLVHNGGRFHCVCQGRRACHRSWVRIMSRDRDSLVLPIPCTASQFRVSPWNFRSSGHSSFSFHFGLCFLLHFGKEMAPNFSPFCRINSLAGQGRK
jgi:hypothetical protein